MRTPEPQPERGLPRSRTGQGGTRRGPRRAPPGGPGSSSCRPGGREGRAATHRHAAGDVADRVERGLAQFECSRTVAYNPIGVVHGGLVCTLADSVAGCAVHTTLDAGIGDTSIDITVNYLRPVTLDSGTLVAVGRVTKPGRRVALAAAEIHDGAGRLVATASSNCLVFPLEPRAVSWVTASGGARSARATSRGGASPRGRSRPA